MDKKTSYGLPVVQLLNSLHIEKNVSRLIAVIRHSSRHYSETPSAEPFMGLTEEGKISAYRWGKLLPAKMRISFFSSFIGRCIETAYLVDKGYITAGGTTFHNIIETSLSPYYVRDAGRFLETCTDLDDFFTSWFAGKIPPEIIDHPRDVAKQMAMFCMERLAPGATGQSDMDICVTHDWNLFAAKEYLLGMNHEIHDTVDYLDGVILFAKNGKCYITCPGNDPRELVVPG